MQEGTGEIIRSPISSRNQTCNRSILALIMAAFLLSGPAMICTAHGTSPGMMPTIEPLTVPSAAASIGNDPVNDPRPLQAIPTYEQSREAARIIDIAMEATKEYLQKAYVEEITESMVIDEIVRVILENGADPYVSAFWSASSDPDPKAGLIVCSGNDTSIPHGNYDDDDWKIIMPGEVVVVDIGARYQGRCSDLTRTFFMGEPSERRQEVYAIVKEAHDLSSAPIDQFIQVRELDKLARDHITENGYGDEFIHGLGHGVGYYIHEPPLITQSAPAGDQPLRLWDVITIEPGIYITNETKGGGEIFGVRIENDYGVILSGNEKLTNFPTDIEYVIIHPPDDQDGNGDDDDSIFGDGGSGSYGVILVLVLVVPAVIILTKRNNERFNSRRELKVKRSDMHQFSSPDWEQENQ